MQRQHLQAFLSILLFGACTRPAEEPLSVEATPALATTCTTAADCSADLGCVSGICAPCTKHAQCESDVCDVYLHTPLGAGRCIPQEEVLYVAHEGHEIIACEQHPGAGTRDDPYCRVGMAITAIGGEKTSIRIYPGIYFPFSVVGDKRVRIYGPAGEGGVAAIYEEDYNGVNIRGGAEVVLDGLTLGGPTRSGADCDGTAESARPTLSIRRSDVLADSGDALTVSRCDLRLDRSRVSGLNVYGGLVLSSAGYEVTNTIISGSKRRRAVRFEASEGRFLFNTVTGNGEFPDWPVAIDCGATPVLIQDSIVFGNVPGNDGSQLTGACELERVVVGEADTIASAGAIHMSPELDDGRLPLTEANRGCCIDKAPVDTAAPVDIDGTRRPQGARADIGAYEAPLP